MKKIVFMVMMAMAVLSTNAQNEYPTAKIEKHDVAILVIDMQNDFVDPKGKLCVAGAKVRYRQSISSSHMAEARTGK